MSAAALSARLAPVLDALADLEREALAQARADNLPDAWATWADLAAARQAVQSVQGREARGRNFAPPVGPEAWCKGAATGADPMAQGDPMADTPCCAHHAPAAAGSKTATTGEDSGRCACTARGEPGGDVVCADMPKRGEPGAGIGTSADPKKGKLRRVKGAA